MNRFALLAFVLAGCSDNAASPAPDAAGVEAVDAAVPPPLPVFMQSAYIKSTKPTHDAHYGKSSLSGAGDSLVATQSGTVNVYERSGSWRVAGELVPSSSSLDYVDFGTQVAMSSDGSTIAVGASEASPSSELGSVYVFRKTGAGWLQEARLEIVDATEVDALALAGDGQLLVVGSSSSSSGITPVRIYARTESTWSLTTTIGGTAQDFHLGLALALAHDGNTFAASVFHPHANDASVEVYVRSGSTWAHRASLVSPSSMYADFATSLSCSATCETIVVGASEPPPPLPSTGPGGVGVAYVFEGDGNAWTPTALLSAKNGEIGDKFGMAVSVSADRQSIIVGAPAESSGSVGLDGDGANNSAPYAGAAYVFRRYQGAWWQVLYLKASNAESLDIFGSSVGIADNGQTMTVGAFYEASSASGVDGDETDNSAPYAGASYVFQGMY